jgi:hypothetical protein
MTDLLAVFPEILRGYPQSIVGQLLEHRPAGPKRGLNRGMGLQCERPVASQREVPADDFRDQKAERVEDGTDEPETGAWPLRNAASVSEQGYWHGLWSDAEGCLRSNSFRLREHDWKMGSMIWAKLTR